MVGLALCSHHLYRRQTALDGEQRVSSLIIFFSVETCDGLETEIPQAQRKKAEEQILTRGHLAPPKGQADCCFLIASHPSFCITPLYVTIPIPT